MQCSRSLKGLALLLVLCAVSLYIPGGSIRPRIVRGAPPEPPDLDAYAVLYDACSGEQGSHTTYITSDTTWTQAHGVYHLTKHVEVYSGVTLTIEPGTQIWLEDNLYVHVCPGASIIAKGTPSQHITFDRYTPSSGPRWNKIWFYNNSSSYFRYVDFSYGGAAASGDDTTLHFSGAGTHVLNNCTIQASKQNGIVAAAADGDVTGTGPDLRIAGTLITNNGRYGIMARNSSTVHITGSTIDHADSIAIYLKSRPTPATITVNDSTILTDGGTYSIYNEMTGSVCVDAQNNWWGAADGPRDTLSGGDACGAGKTNNGGGSDVSYAVAHYCRAHRRHHHATRCRLYHHTRHQRSAPAYYPLHLRCLRQHGR